jgi:hypothetical protein
MVGLKRLQEARGEYFEKSVCGCERLVERLVERKRTDREARLYTRLYK